MSERANLTRETATQQETGADVERPEAVAARLRRQGERVRRRELETALQRLEAHGEVTPAERRVVARLAARLTGSLVESWAEKLDAEDVDPDDALALLAE